MLREQGALFLSDDMTIVDSQGMASCFPKPLTISHHTLRAVQARPSPGVVRPLAFNALAISAWVRMPLRCNLRITRRTCSARRA